jgi:methanogenic corrinoid protein MtbC1
MVNVQLLTQAIGELDESQVIAVLTEFVAATPTAEEALNVLNACQQGMNVVGERYETGEYFVGDLIFAGELLTRAVEMIKPVLQGAGTATIGKIVLGTVQGDIHDIGKNIFKSLVEAGGFKVYDLGVDTSPEAFVAKAREVGPDVVGMSGVLNLATTSMKNTVDALKAAGLRDGVKVLIGGNPVNSEICKNVGADACTTNAAQGVKICQGWVR